MPQPPRPTPATPHTLPRRQCGLDKLHQPTGAGMEQQMEVFAAQLALAEELQRPVTVRLIVRVRVCVWVGGGAPWGMPAPLPRDCARAQVHCVKAYEQVLGALRALSSPALPVVMHSWGGSPEQVQAFLRLQGACVYFSISGHLLHKPPAKALPTVRTFCGPSNPCNARTHARTHAPAHAPAAARHPVGAPAAGERRPRRLSPPLRRLAGGTAGAPGSGAAPPA